MKGILVREDGVIIGTFETVWPSITSCIPDCDPPPEGEPDKFFTAALERVGHKIELK